MGRVGRKIDICITLYKIFRIYIKSMYLMTKYHSKSCISEGFVGTITR